MSVSLAALSQQSACAVCRDVHECVCLFVCLCVRESKKKLSVLEAFNCGIERELKSSHTGTTGEDKPLPGKCPT